MKKPEILAPAGSVKSAYAENMARGHLRTIRIMIRLLQLLMMYIFIIRKYT